MAFDVEEGAADEFGEDRDERVAEGGETGTAKAASRSQRLGNPIIHSTKRRRSAVPFTPPREACSESGRLFFAAVASLVLPERKSRASGVASNADLRFGRFGAVLPKAPP